jgi:large subunit ribosomal protein L22
MEGRAQARFLRMSARKVHRVLDLIRGQQVEEAINTLHFSNKRAARAVEKVVRSAVSNVMAGESSGKVDIDTYVVKSAWSDGGPMIKRFLPRAMGRATRIRKRTCHVTVIVAPRS